MTSAAHNATMTVFYKVGGVEKAIKGVDVAELRRGIESLWKTHPRPLATTFNAMDVNDILENIRQSKVTKLEVTEDVTCATNFLDKWWQSPTNAASVLCLMNSIVEAANKQQQADLDKKIREKFVVSGEKVQQQIGQVITEGQINAWIAQTA